ncbi:MAG: hypothetical protein HQK79_21950 [Desulfobacterales bacterium]|nr:hypothetical protein [Desulfobacterales bacterium]
MYHTVIKSKKDAIIDKIKGISLPMKAIFTDVIKFASIHDANFPFICFTFVMGCLIALIDAGATKLFKNTESFLGLDYNTFPKILSCIIFWGFLSAMNGYIGVTLEIIKPNKQGALFASFMSTALLRKLIFQFRKDIETIKSISPF